jgi:NAD(P)-dependent dehydrogenase (short-subunit alcohol dehydrogenase family)
MGYLEDRANLHGKVAVVVGGGSGVGAAVTVALAGAGAHVVFGDRKGEAIEATVAAAARVGGRATGHVVDAFDPEQLRAFYDGIGLASIDVLVNVPGEVHFQRFAETGRAEWQRDIHHNFAWVLESIGAALPLLRASGRGGSIVNFTTIEAGRGAAGFAAYAGAKAALANFSRALAVELASEHIRVNTVAPDTTPSETSANALPDDVKRAMWDAAAHVARSLTMECYVPMGAAPPADAIGDAVVFLASDLSSWTTGATLPVDGGTSASLGFLHWPGAMEWSPGPPISVLRTEAFD